MKGNQKQSNKRKKGNVVLQKYMVALDEFIKSKGGYGEAETEHDLKFVKKKSRKEFRKEKRKMKKSKMKSHYEGKSNLSLPVSNGENAGTSADKQQQRKKMDLAKKEVSKIRLDKSSHAPPEKSENSKSLPKKRKNINKLQESRKRALLEANEDENREIKKLERCLGLNKRKNKKKLPRSFVADGLDYILGVLDSGSSAVGMYGSDDDMDIAKEKFEKLDKNDPQLSGEDVELGDEMASESSDEDLDSFDEKKDGAMDDDEEVMKDEDELDESDAADSDDEIEGQAEEEAVIPDPQTMRSKTKTVS